MRRGNTPTIDLDQDGEIIAISTGSDYCAEHEMGSAPMMSTLCSGHQGNSYQADAKLISILRSGGVPDYPELLDRKAMDRNLDHLTFSDGIEPLRNRASAVIAFHATPRATHIDHPELALRNSATFMAGAWDDSSFAFKGVGDEIVLKMRRFYERLLAGDGVFAGSFFVNAVATGVVIAVRSKLRPEDLLQVEVAQSKWKSDLSLRAKSRLDELASLFSNKAGHKHARSPGHIWPIWRDDIVGGEVVYGLNPTNDSVAPYFGPYEFEQLHDWILAEKKTKLVPYSRQEAKLL